MQKSRREGSEITQNISWQIGRAVPKDRTKEQTKVLTKCKSKIHIRDLDKGREVTMETQRQGTRVSQGVRERETGEKSEKK